MRRRRIFFIFAFYAHVAGQHNQPNAVAGQKLHQCGLVLLLLGEHFGGKACRCNALLASKIKRARVGVIADAQGNGCGGIGRNQRLVQRLEI